MTTFNLRVWQKALAGAIVITLGTAGVFAQKIQINGAGATFPAPIYSKWFSEYNKLHPNVEINYQPIGSGGGIAQIQKNTVFFGASDGPMTNEALTASPGKILHFPTVLGGVVPIYNVTGVTQELKFTGAVLADIFLGKITKWNDPAIAKLNAGVNLPGQDIVVVHRSDGSGTTYIWCDYLHKVSPEWTKKVGVATSVSWPLGIGAKGSDGVAGQVKQQPGAIGYGELVYALQNKIEYGSVQAKDGAFLKASLETVTAAAAAATAAMPKDFRVSITNAPGANSYPISSFTWLLLYQSPKDKNLSNTMNDFVKWMLTDGQKYCKDLGYAPLPDAVVKLEMAQLATVK